MKIRKANRHLTIFLQFRKKHWQAIKQDASVSRRFEALTLGELLGLLASALSRSAAHGPETPGPVV